MSTSPTNLAARPRAWVVSPAWDLTYLVLTPLAIVPAVLVAVRHWLAPEQIYLAVIAFASLGHHLPGFMRAYGDRDLFSRFRWRFLLAPPLVFALALVFTPPQVLADVLSLPWSHLHGLELILLIWGTWHGLMQTFGFMRIYDIRRGENERSTARLDQALCLTIFACGVVFSDTRMFGIAGAMWQSGLPTFGPESLRSARIACGAVGLGVLFAYAIHLVNRYRKGLPLNGVKLMLAATTGWFYWYCGRLSTNVLVGIAMFEIYHAVQYNAIVWIYNRRLFDRAGERFGPLGFLFRDRLTMLGAYLGAIAAYSSIRFLTAQAGDRMFSGDVQDARQWLIAAFVTSSMLHFYYDGFIWKVSERATRDNLANPNVTTATLDRFVRPMAHAGKWALLLAIAASLVGAERSFTSGNELAVAAREEHLLRALARLTPDTPQSQEIAAKIQAADADRAYARGLEQLRAGNAEAALKPLREAVELNPMHFPGHLQLGDALMALGKPAAASDAYGRAIHLKPEFSDARVALADAQLQCGRPNAAEATLRQGLRNQPESPELNFTLGLLLQQQGRQSEAAPFLQRARRLGLKR